MRNTSNIFLVLALIVLLVILCGGFTGCAKTAGGTATAPEVTTTGTLSAAPHEPRTLQTKRDHTARAYMWDERDVELIAKTLYGETRCDDIPTDQKAAVAWCILNRVDAGWGTIEEVVTANLQFTGYRASNPVWDSLYELTLDVLNRWQAEHDGVEDVGRTIPADYLYFTGDGERNNFKREWKSGETPWDWSLESPYNN